MRYFVLDDSGGQYGPADVLTLQQWINEGRLLPHQKLKEEMSGTESFARDLPGLVFQAAAGTPTGPGATQDTFASNPYEAGPRPQQFAEYNRPGGGGPIIDTQGTLIKAIICTLCCCLPLGIASIIFAVQAKNSSTNGNNVQAEEEKRKSNLFSNIGLIGGAVINIGYFVFTFIAAASGAVK